MLKKILKSYDYTLIIAVILLCAFGLVMIYSASMVTAVSRFDVPSDYFYQKQKISLLVASAGFLAALIIPYKALAGKRILMWIFFGTILGLGAVFLLGHTAGNAKSWIKFGTRAIQPAEFAKLAVIVYLSAIFAKRQSYIERFDKAVMPPIIYLVVVTLLVAIQPDYGTAFIILLIAISVIISSGMGLKNMMRIGALALAAATVIIPFLLLSQDVREDIFSKERMSRITSFQDPFKYEASDGYQLVNSYIAIGAGGLKGLGLGESIQKYGYLPESHTDFIMAVIAEELGLFGVSFVLLLLAYIVIKGFIIARKCVDPFGSMLAIGISSMIGIQAFINLGGLTGLIPITGVPLPFISYGGSSLLLLMISTGILINVSMLDNFKRKYGKKKEKPQTDRKTYQRNHLSF